MADKKKEFFKTKVYYGEYTLRHWLDLMLSRNITLPEYQRHFVWEESDVVRLVDSMKSGQFVMPVTIAHYKVSGVNKNLILDGQQRLTSILLAFLGYKVFKFKVKNPADGLKENKEYIGITKKYMITEEAAIMWKHIADDVYLVYNEGNRRG